MARARVRADRRARNKSATRPPPPPPPKTTSENYRQIKTSSLGRSAALDPFVLFIIYFIFLFSHFVIVVVVCFIFSPLCTSYVLIRSPLSVPILTCAHITVQTYNNQIILSSYMYTECFTKSVNSSLFL